MSRRAAPGRFQIGRVLQNAASAMHQNFAPFLAVSALLIGAPSFLMSWSQQWMTDAAQLGDMKVLLVRYSLFLGAILLYFLAAMLLQAAVIHGAVADLTRRRASFSEMMSAAFGKILPLVGFSLLYGLALGAGFVVVVAVAAAASMGGGSQAVGAALVIGVLIWLGPVVAMIVVWAVGPPAIVIEGAGPLRAFGRSAFLTRGYRVRIFLLLLISILIALVLSFGFNAVRLLFFFALGPGPIGTSLSQALTYILTSMISAAGVAALYYELRQIKEGVGPETLASVFE